MNPEDVRVLLAARAAIEAGEDPAAIDRAIRARTEGRYADLDSLEGRARDAGDAVPRAARGERQAVLTGPGKGRFNPANDTESIEAHGGSHPGEGPPESDAASRREMTRRYGPDRSAEAALARLNARGGSAGGDFLRMGAQGLTFGFADEIAGAGSAVRARMRGEDAGEAYRSTRDASRQRVEDLRALNPGASALATLAGGLAVPGAAFARGGGAAAVRGGRVAGATARGAGTGAVSGGLFGIGEAEGTLSERAPSGAVGAVGGGALGGLFGAAAAAVPRVRGAIRGGGSADDLAESLGELAGVPGGRIGTARDLARARSEQVRAQGFGSLERQIQSVDDAEVLATLRDPEILPAVRRVLGDEASDRAPSFSEVLEIRKGLRKDGTLARLDSVLDRRVPGFAGARQQLRAAQTAERAFDRGWDMARKPAESIGRAMRDMDAETAEAFRQGIASNWYHRLSTKGGEVTAGQMERLRSAGVSAQLRHAFRRPEHFDEFQRQIHQHGRASVDRARLVNAATWAAKWGGGAIGLGAGLGGAMSLFNN